MKFIIAFIGFFTTLALIISGGGAFLYRLALASPVILEAGSQAHLVKAAMYAAIGVGLPLAMATAVVSVLLTFFSFVFKSWFLAVYNAALCAGAAWCWNFFLTAPYPPA